MLKILFYILIVIILLYILTPTKLSDNLISTPITLHNKSTGVFDGPAKLALKKLQNKTNKTSNDKLLEAKIISENILEGETPLRSPITIKVANKYTEALRNPPANIEPYLLDSAENFNAKLANTVVIEDDIEIFNDFNILIGNLGTNINLARQVQAADVKKQQIEISPTEKAAVNNYLDAVKSYTSDPQNSHDTNVSKEIRKTLDIIENENSIDKSIDEVFVDINEYIRKSDITVNKKQKAKHSLNIIKDRNDNVIAANRKETDVIKLIWTRAEHPNNSDNEENIKLAVIDALIDITSTNEWGETNTVCPNGRISRLVGALSALDFNTAVGSLETSDQINNYILEQAAHTYNQYIKNNPGPIVDALNTKEGAPEGPELDKFNEGLKSAVNKMLADNNASDSIKEKIYIGFGF